jgi:hypothetical protein
VTGWTPANDLEAGLADALRDGDLAVAAHLLAGAELLVADPAALVEVAGQPCLPVFTSEAALVAGTRGQASRYRIGTLRDLAEVLILLDPLTPLQWLITPAAATTPAAPGPPRPSG